MWVIFLSTLLDNNCDLRGISVITDTLLLILLLLLLLLCFIHIFKKKLCYSFREYQLTWEISCLKQAVNKTKRDHIRNDDIRNMGPSFACILMVCCEHLIMQQDQGVLPELHKRNIDDDSGITDMLIEELRRFIDFVSTFHPDIKLTSSTSVKTVNFLDLSITISISHLATFNHYKLTDAHAFLLSTFSLNNPTIEKMQFLLLNLLRLCSICQDTDNFWQKSHEILDFFHRRLCPNRILDLALLGVPQVN